MRSQVLHDAHALFLYNGATVPHALVLGASRAVSYKTDRYSVLHIVCNSIILQDTKYSECE